MLGEFKNSVLYCMLKSLVEEGLDDYKVPELSYGEEESTPAVHDSYGMDGHASATGNDIVFNVPDYDNLPDSAKACLLGDKTIP